jgi:hypothetical protein
MVMVWSPNPRPGLLDDGLTLQHLIKRGHRLVLVSGT